MNDLEKIRIEYTQKSLSENEVANDPIEQFKSWFAETLESDVNEPTAFTLSTATKDGLPSARIVLLKGIDTSGFKFYTNYQSRKGNELLENPFAAMTFFWKELERQVRVEGSISRLSEPENTEYFMSRPKGSQIGAWASPQSEVIEDRKYLEQAEKRIADKYPNEVPKPPHWGGYLLKPNRIEFWQGRMSRLHDRILYTLEDDQWEIKRLAP